MRYQRTFLVASILLVGLAGAGCKDHSGDSAVAGAGGPQAIHVDPEQAAALVNDGKVTVLDVRTEREFAAGHIAGAILLDFNQQDFQMKVSTLDRTKSYLVHCASGGRSTSAIPIMQKVGFRSLYHLDGGLNAWIKAGKPVEK